MTRFPMRSKSQRASAGRIAGAFIFAAVTGVLSGTPIAAHAETGESLETFIQITPGSAPLQVIERLEVGPGLLRDAIVGQCCLERDGKLKTYVHFFLQTDPTGLNSGTRPVGWGFYGISSVTFEPRSIYYWGSSFYEPAISMPSPAVEGANATTRTTEGAIFPEYSQIEFTTRWGAVERRTTTSGFGYDAVALNYESVYLRGADRTLNRRGKLFWGHKLGIVGVDEREVWHNDPDRFDLFDLPPPQAESPVIEYRNTKDFPDSPGGQFFYTADPGEQAFVDGGGAGAYLRTGKSFKSGGYVRACRFYGSPSPGPNSHFYTADDTECKGLRAQQQVPVPDDLPQWNSEGIAFSINAIKLEANGDRSCPSGSIPVYRAYNRAFDGAKKNSWNSNHRLSIAQEDIDEMVRVHGWVNEGAIMCAAM